MSDSRIKLVQVIADSELGGGPNHVLGILKHLDLNKFEPFLLCPPGYLMTEAKKIEGVTVFEFDPGSKFDFLAIWQLREIYNKIRVSRDPFGPLIIHSHGPRAGLMARMAAPWRAKLVYTEHRHDADYHLKSSFNEWIQRRVLRAQSKKTDLIIAVSDAVKKFLIQSKMARPEQVRVIPNAVDLSRWTLEARKEIAERKPGSNWPTDIVIGTVGTLNYQKGQIFLIDAMAKLVKSYPLITLEIIGEGEERSALEAEIKRLDLDRNVTLLGAKNPEKWYKRWDLFVLPSIAETFGIVILEAMKNGLPIVATRVGGVPDIITHRKNGFLVAPGDAKAISKGIEEVLGNPIMRTKLHREAMDRVKRYDWRKVIKALEESYGELF